MGHCSWLYHDPTNPPDKHVTATKVTEDKNWVFCSDTCDMKYAPAERLQVLINQVSKYILLIFHLVQEVALTILPQSQCPNQVIKQIVITNLYV